MSVSRKDVNFLRSIVKRMDKDRLITYKPGSNRNAYAMILRFKGKDGVCVSRMFSPHDINDLKPHDILNRLEAECKEFHPPSLTMLYVRQKDTAEHRWSSSIIFPGGKRDTEEDKDDISAVRRHAYAQLGIPLKGQFVLLGRLPDIWNYSRDLEGGTMNCRFVFLHIGDMTPSLRLANHVVASTAWVPLTLMNRQNISRDRIKHQFYAYLRSGTLAHSEVRDLVSNTMMYFPSIKLPGDLGEHFGDVWGSTLSWTSTLLVYDRRRRLDWPVVTTDSFFLQNFVIYPLHGYLEIRKHEVCEGEGVNPLHVFCLFNVCSIFLCIMGVVCYAVGITLYVLYDALLAGGGKGESELAKATEEAAEFYRVKNFFNIPWQLLLPKNLQDNKIGAPTEQENKEIIETKTMFDKLVKQVEKAPIPSGGAVVVWSDSFNNPVRERYSTKNSDEKERKAPSDNADVQALLSSEADYYTSLNEDDHSQDRLENKRKDYLEKEAREKEKRKMVGAVPELPSQTILSGVVHEALSYSAGGYSSSNFQAQVIERRKEYQKELKRMQESKSDQELNDAIQGLSGGGGGDHEINQNENENEQQQQYFYSQERDQESDLFQQNNEAGQSNNNSTTNNDTQQEEQQNNKKWSSSMMTSEEIEQQRKEYEAAKYAQMAKDDVDQESKIEAEVSSMQEK